MGRNLRNEVSPNTENINPRRILAIIVTIFMGAILSLVEVDRPIIGLACFFGGRRGGKKLTIKLPKNKHRAAPLWTIPKILYQKARQTENISYLASGRGRIQRYDQ
jgi:hypothetical protein